MGAQSALRETEDKIARALKQIAEKSACGGPAEGHDATGHAGDDQCERQLHRTNPGSNGRTEFQVSHAHAAEPAKYAQKQCAEPQSRKTLPNAAPTMKPR